jgi:hypothetical protein
MLFKGTIIGPASGSIAGITASHNQGGQYFRNRSVPTNPGTAFQGVVRNAMATLTSRWQNGLTTAQREAWAVYAANVPVINKLGDPINLNGLNMYVRCNIPRIQAGLGIVDPGPTVYSLASLSPIAATGLVDDLLTFTFDDSDLWASAATGALLIYGSRDQSVTTNFFKGPYRFGFAEPGAATPPTSPQTGALPFVGVSGNRTFLRALATNPDGRLSGAQTFLVVAT